MKLYFRDKLNLFKPQLFEDAAISAFKKLQINGKIEIGLIITDNIEIRKLNNKYRHIDKETDVLSFPVDKPDKKEQYTMLGDIVISYQMAQQYAQKTCLEQGRETCLERSRENKEDIKKELVMLFKHGLLHLLGYDHEKNKKEWQEAELKIVNC